MGISRKQNMSNFLKNEHVHISREEMFFFRKIWRALFSWNTRFEIRPFTLLPTKYASIYSYNL